MHRQFGTFVDQSPSGLDRLWTFGYPSGPLQIFCVHQPRWKPYRSITRLTVLPLGLDSGHGRGCPSAKLSGFKPKRVAPSASPEGSSESEGVNLAVGHYVERSISAASPSKLSADAGYFTGEPTAALLKLAQRR